MSIRGSKAILYIVRLFQIGLLSGTGIKGKSTVNRLSVTVVALGRYIRSLASRRSWCG